MGTKKKLIPFKRCFVCNYSFKNVSLSSSQGSTCGSER